jgi:hypothetical protein
MAEARWETDNSLAACTIHSLSKHPEEAPSTIISRSMQFDGASTIHMYLTLLVVSSIK